ncbi:hypothetical protein [Alteraurantiacibacter aquimixticola]|uniref:DUF3592 domain-containing protein n=1 Tax=Alteraurantiacibacter aquimixticola TaxID=2489173 RepID=A0A4T3F0R4_9SPHN|nr:hypothetical protein [Alteraurantiacibacter aquimixticola]TIX50639.1 hypothetical protein E5222_10300 [Alteraurantiacibacter aquimixticola]
MSVILPIALILAAIIAVVVWRGRQFGELARRGVPVTGTVVKKFRTGSTGGVPSGKRIAFTYRGPDGKDYRRAASIATGKWQELELDGPIDLICLPDRPGVSAPAWLVEAAREALAKR